MIPGLERLPLDAPIPEFPDDAFEQVLRRGGYRCIAGVDEVGRGCLAGPVVAAAAVLPEGWTLDGLTDSKQMPEDARNLAEERIKAEALWAIGICSPAEIDRWNILRASLEAMNRAIKALPAVPDFLLVDGNQKLPVASTPQQTLVKGDGRSVSIAAASVLAKVERDRIMTELDRKHPEFGWASNVGYPTAEHFDALNQLGPTPHHRKSFRLRVENTTQGSLF